ncbi:MAG: hypothetical protein ACI4VF_06110 [Lachnospirales bacterium]
MNIIEYRFENIQPVRIRNCNTGADNQIETLKYITGSAMRGFIVGNIANLEPQYFSSFKKEILSDSVKFYNAYPIIDDKISMPSPKNYYAEKTAPNQLMSVFLGLEPGLKRAKIGGFCNIKNNKIYFTDVNIGASMNNNINHNENEKNQVFRCQFISAGQSFGGYITVENNILADKIVDILNNNNFRIGAGFTKGYGLCKCTYAKIIDTMPYSQYRGEAKLTMTMMLLSDTSMVDKYGEPCGIDFEYIEEQLGSFVIKGSASSVIQSQGHNNTWGCDLPSVVMYEKGSVFRIEFSQIPHKEKLDKIQNNGIGIRREEGYGQVIFTDCLSDRLESIEYDIKTNKYEKKPIKDIDEINMLKKLAVCRCRQLISRGSEKYVVDLKDNLFEGLSNSEKGDIKSLITMCKYNIERTEESINIYFENKKKRTPSTYRKFEKAFESINKILDSNIYEKLEIDTEVFGIDTDSLFDKNEKMWYKLDLIEKIIAYDLRKEE